MKTCLRISGHLRTFRVSSELERTTAQSVGVMFYVPWKDIESKTNSWHNNHMPNRTIEDSDVSFIESVMNPKSLIFEEQVDFGINKNLYPKQVLNGLKEYIMVQKNL